MKYIILFTSLFLLYSCNSNQKHETKTNIKNCFDDFDMFEFKPSKNKREECPCVEYIRENNDSILLKVYTYGGEPIILKYKVEKNYFLGKKIGKDDSGILFETYTYFSKDFILEFRYDEKQKNTNDMYLSSVVKILRNKKIEVSFNRYYNAKHSFYFDFEGLLKDNKNNIHTTTYKTENENIVLYESYKTQNYVKNSIERYNRNKQLYYNFSVFWHIYIIPL